jgi:hypothetical protein
MSHWIEFFSEKLACEHGVKNNQKMIRSNYMSIEDNNGGVSAMNVDLIRNLSEFFK